MAKCNFQSIFPYLQTIYGFFLIVKKIFSSDFPQKIILDYIMFTLVLHWKIIARGRNTFNNAITVMYFLTFILKDPVGPNPVVLGPNQVDLGPNPVVQGHNPVNLGPIPVDQNAGVELCGRIFAKNQKLSDLTETHRVFPLV